MIGNDCPECGARLSGRKCRCGWTAEPDESSTPGRQTCARCGDKSPSTTEFHADGAPEDRGQRLCPSCWIPALKRRAERDPISAKERAASRHALYAALDRIDARNAAVTRPAVPRTTEGVPL